MQVSNHLRKWKKIYGKIVKLKSLSAANWDEESCTITLEREHYIGHIQDHREDADYLNTPIEHYHEMATIFGNSLATGTYAKGANDPLATEVTEKENVPKDIEDASPTNDQVGAMPDEVTMSVNNTSGESSGTKPPPPKKAKVTVEDPNITMVTMISQSLGNLAAAITNVTKAITSDGDIPKGLYDAMMSIPGFDATHLDHYYAYLCDHPPQAKVFYKLPLSSKMIWVARYIKEHLSDADL
ncbi:hypothetical protein SEVIR_6G059600v4 [Setaria viridis]|uniref:Myb/SANT-like domain-containing protein n=1 Tax=Setaria viridis TaxID=4556 RepID=A0A4U6U0K9_SETVI|nr:hypothetical protein SEVIR_6G059600v2 [Setaria viridis]